jgi:hypothetical protein
VAVAIRVGGGDRVRGGSDEDGQREKPGRPEGSVTVTTEDDGGVAQGGIHVGEEERRRDNTSPPTNGDSRIIY